MNVKKQMVSSALIIASIATVCIAQSARTHDREARADKTIRQRADVDTSVDPQVRPEVAAENAFSRISMFVSEDGRMEIAGVVRFEEAAAGSMIVEVREFGDFARDQVLSITVPVEFTVDGELVTTAIRSVANKGQNIVLSVQSGAVGGIAVVGQCYTVLPNQWRSPVLLR